MKSILLSTLLLFLFASSSQGILNLYIDTIAKTVALSGEDDGSATFDIDNFRFTAKWSDGSTAGAIGSVQFSNVSIGGGSGALGNAYLVVYSSGLEFRVESANSYGDIQAFPNITSSYASLNGTAQLALESYIGQNLSLTEGSGYNPASVTGFVPEPGTTAALLGCMALSITAALRRRRA